MWEERWVRDEGYSKIIPEAVTGLFKKLSITIKDVDTLSFPASSRQSTETSPEPWRYSGKGG